jgi:hypothetical protein
MARAEMNGLAVEFLLQSRVLAAQFGKRAGGDLLGQRASKNRVDVDAAGGRRLGVEFERARAGQ